MSNIKRITVLPYRRGSASAGVLARSISQWFGRKVFRVLPDSRTYRARTAPRLFVNWGSSGEPVWNLAGHLRLNNPAAVRRASNKLLTFQAFAAAGIACPEWTADPTVARTWGDKAEVFARTALNGHSGRGIVPCTPGTLANAPLYTKYIPKKDEFRVHVFQGQVIDIQQKKKRLDLPPERVNFKIRSYENGWVFCRQNIRKPDDLEALAIAAVQSLGLDFGAVDIIYNEKNNKCFALEVNTAPGLTGQTVNSYSNAIRNYVERIRRA